MPRDESCPNFAVCIAGYEPDEIDYACDHCDLVIERLGLCDPAVENISPATAGDSGFRRGIDSIDGLYPNVAAVLRALESPKIQKRLREIISDDLRNNGSLRAAIIESVRS